MRLPSVKTIEKILRCDNFAAKAIRGAMESFRDNGENSRDLRRSLQVIDSIIDGHGVEFLRSNQDTIHAFHGLEYVNMGDPYRATVLFDHASQSFSVGCWGDVVERNPRRFGE
jgi:hypothetical protein